jgi:hypothetical protein
MRNEDGTRPHNYIPNPDDAFDTWFSAYMTYAVANAVALGSKAGPTDSMAGHRTLRQSHLSLEQKPGKVIYGK